MDARLWVVNFELKQLYKHGWCAEGFNKSLVWFGWNNIISREKYALTPMARIKLLSFICVDYAWKCYFTFIRKKNNVYVFFWDFFSISFKKKQQKN